MKYRGKKLGQLAMFAAFAAMCAAPQTAGARGYKAVDGAFGGVVSGRVSFEGALPVDAIDRLGHAPEVHAGAATGVDDLQ